MVRIVLRLAVFGFLTLLTQIGGLAYLLALPVKRRLLAFTLLYLGLTVAATWIAPLTGRIALSCWQDGPLQVQSWFYCATNRNYVSTELAEVLRDTSQTVDRAYPGTETLVLDAGFPFLTGFPLLPHLSHDDGEKADLAFYYKGESGYLAGQTRSPVGYFAFEDGPTDCPKVWPTLRWNVRPLQPYWANYTIEPERTRHLLTTLADDSRVGKILLEPHLKSTLALTSEKIRFQGCRAARHDDNIHLQL